MKTFSKKNILYLFRTCVIIVVNKAMNRSSRIFNDAKRAVGWCETAGEKNRTCLGA